MIKIAHSPDSDDAFMFYAIKHKKIELQGLEFQFDSSEIQVLNQAARNNPDLYDIFAISFHAYPYLATDFQILRSGASMGSKNHGPRLVCTEEFYKKYSELQSQTELQSFNAVNPNPPKIAVPGEMTSAYLVFEIFSRKNEIHFEPVFCKFDEVFDLLDSGKVDASILIHESQLKFEDYGFKEILNLGEWWYQSYEDFNMPLGTNVIKRSIQPDLRKKIANILHDSIEWGINNFEETLEYSRDFSQNGLSDQKAKDYINMYVNNSTLELTGKDIKSIKFMYKKASMMGLIPFDDNEILVDPI